MAKNSTISISGHFIPCNEPMDKGSAQLLSSHVANGDLHVTADLKKLLVKLQASATNNTTISIDSVTGLREILSSVSGAFVFRGSCTAAELEEKEKNTGDVWQVGDKEYACDGTNWVELGFNIDLSSYVTSTALETVLSDYALSSALSDYVLTSTLTSTLSDYVLSSTLATTLESYVLTSALSDYATIASLADYATVASLSNYALVSSLSNYATTTTVTTHTDDTTIHVTAEDKAAWNAKASTNDIANAVNPVISRVSALEGAVAVLDPTSAVALSATFISSGSVETPEEITFAAGKRYVATKAFTGTLPASPADGSMIYLYIKDGIAEMTVSPGAGDKLDGSTNPYSVGLDTNGLAIASINYVLVYNATDKNWILL